ncbi:hypothetical protein [Microbacterium sp. SA39]|uniref:hypothetical protein n=1 Tax=Microbacterium sp. SA39 TaxID=1263625 RepID=UPI0005FA4026|nr:hypothetical protein [Microbacterium sp. SA39]KJQ54173.1 hypothetical protein RS85_02245 [Microbacterium sp. SA39]
MENDGGWSLFGAFVCLAFGAVVVSDGVGPEWYDYVSVAIAYGGASLWIARYVVDRRRAATAAERAEAEIDARPGGDEV